MDVDEGSQASQSSVGINLKKPDQEESKSVLIEKKNEEPGKTAENTHKALFEHVFKKLIVQMKAGCSKAVCF